MSTTAKRAKGELAEAIEVVKLMEQAYRDSGGVTKKGQPFYVEKADALRTLINHVQQVQEMHKAADDIEFDSGYSIGRAVSDAKWRIQNLNTGEMRSRPYDTALEAFTVIKEITK